MNLFLYLMLVEFLNKSFYLKLSQIKELLL